MNYWSRVMTDETGEPSFFRFAATAVLIFAGWFTVKAVGGTEIPEWVASFWLPVTLTLLAGAGGPRMVSYLAQMGATIIQRARGMVSSSYREVEQTTVVDDDPVKDK